MPADVAALKALIAENRLNRERRPPTPAPAADAVAGRRDRAPARPGRAARRRSAPSRSRPSMRWAACSPRTCARCSTCRRQTTARWTATRCAPPTSPRRARCCAVSQRIAAGSVGAAARAGHRRAHLHRRPGAGRRRCGRHAGAVRRRSTAACASMPSPRAGPVDPPPRRGRRSAAPPCSRAGMRLDAAGARHGGLGRRGDAAGRRAGRAWRCSPPATSWRCRASRSSPGAIYNSNRFTLRGLIQALGGVCDDLGIVPDRLDATRETLRRAAARQRPDRHLRRRVGRRGRPHEAGRRAGRAARPLADRDQAGQAAGLRRGLPRRRLVGLVHRPAGQPGVGVRHLPARRAAGAAAPAGRDRPRARGRSRCAPTSPGRRPTGAASSCACAATPTAASICSANQGSARADLDDLGRRPGRQPAAARRSRPATPSATCRFAELLAMKVAGALLRLGARGARRRARRSRSAPGAHVGALRDALAARGGRHAEVLGAAAASCAAPATASSAPRRRVARRGRRGRLLPAGDRRLSGSRQAAASRSGTRTSISAPKSRRCATATAASARSPPSSAPCATAATARAVAVDGARALSRHDRGGDRGDDRRGAARASTSAPRASSTASARWRPATQIVLVAVDLGASRRGVPGLRVPDGLPEDAGAVLEEGSDRRRRALGRRPGRPTTRPWRAGASQAGNAAPGPPPAEG